MNFRRKMFFVEFQNQKPMHRNRKFFEFRRCDWKFPFQMKWKTIANYINWRKIRNLHFISTTANRRFAREKRQQIDIIMNVCSSCQNRKTKWANTTTQWKHQTLNERKHNKQRIHISHKEGRQAKKRKRWVKIRTVTAEKRNNWKFKFKWHFNGDLAAKTSKTLLISAFAVFLCRTPRHSSHTKFPWLLLSFSYSFSFKLLLLPSDELLKFTLLQFRQMCSMIFSKSRCVTRALFRLNNFRINCINYGHKNYTVSHKTACTVVSTGFDCILCKCNKRANEKPQQRKNGATNCIN